MEEKRKIRDMKGMQWENPKCVHSIYDLKDLIDEAGFLPLFRNDIEGFSVEEYTVAENWWTKNEEIDPWLWRVQLVQSNDVAYGKFFCKKAGYISKKWLPYFVNMARDGYDFDSLYEDGYAKNRSKKIMELFEQEDTISSVNIKKLAGFGKGGEKNFNGTLTELQMQLYLVIKEFHRRRNKSGQEYGLHVAYYGKPESIWGYDYITSCYGEDSECSRNRIEDFMKKRYTDGTAISKFLKTYHL